MKKRIICALLALVLIFSAASTAFAMNEGDWRIVFGADLTEAERVEVLGMFGVDAASLDGNRVLTVTNAEERSYLAGKVPEARIGRRAISSIYIRALPEGSGLDISTHNISYCTAEMYRSILTTVGITDAVIIVAAPRSVSGTAALTGIYKAYEDLTGKVINDYAKLAGIEELLTTGELAELIGSDEATEVIVELKKILDETQYMDDEAVKEKIRQIADEYKVTLTDEQVQQILTLSRTLEGLDVEQIRSRALALADAANGWQRFTEGVQKVIADIGAFFSSIAEFFRNIFTGIFGGGNAE